MNNPLPEHRYKPGQALNVVNKKSALYAQDVTVHRTIYKRMEKSGRIILAYIVRYYVPRGRGFSVQVAILPEESLRPVNTSYREDE